MLISGDVCRRAQRSVPAAACGGAACACRRALLCSTYQPELNPTLASNPLQHFCKRDADGMPRDPPLDPNLATDDCIDKLVNFLSWVADNCPGWTHWKKNPDAMVSHQCYGTVLAPPAAPATGGGSSGAPAGRRPCQHQPDHRSFHTCRLLTYIHAA
jgi:hypothetical protein